MSVFNHIPFGLIGLGLAVLDFTGSSKKLEAWAARYVEHERSYARRARAEILTADVAYHKEALGNFLPSAAVIVLIFAVAWIALGDSNRLLWLKDWLPSWPIWSVALWGPAILMVWYAFDHLTGRSFAYMKSLMLWWPLWILSRPKAGIIGTLGLLVAAIDNFAN